jgi:hypothetical protein
MAETPVTSLRLPPDIRGALDACVTWRAEQGVPASQAEVATAMMRLGIRTQAATCTHPQRRLVDQPDPGNPDPLAFRSDPYCGRCGTRLDNPIPEGGF